MKTLTIATPTKQAYNGMNIEEIASMYETMAYEGFDKLFTFETHYKTFMKTPDYQTNNVSKLGPQKTFLYFHEQPVRETLISNKKLKSSSWIITRRQKNLHLPEAEAVLLESNGNLISETEMLQNFYEDNKWIYKTLSGEQIPTSSWYFSPQIKERFRGNQKIIPPHKIQEIKNTLL